MTSPHVHIVDEVPELDSTEGVPGPVLVTVLEGFLDAGGAAQSALAHLLAADAGRVVATFEIDAFYDYRARRPPMTFSEDHYEDYQPPRLVCRLVHDEAGTAYLLLHGPEPDTHWEAFCAAVREVVEHFGVSLVISWGAVPMAVPHTRPVMVTHHANRPELVTRSSMWRGAIRIPASALALLELRLGEWGHPAAGFVAHVPHYLAQVDYPLSALPLLEAASEATGLRWDLAALHARAAERAEDITRQVEDSAEIRDVVAGLEQQYDAFHRPDDDERLPMADEGELPTADQLGAQFERFLADLDEGDRDDKGR
jgi:predicted ATP-grasp superfamily ATP-dependent carboligase